MTLTQYHSPRATAEIGHSAKAVVKQATDSISSYCRRVPLQDYPAGVELLQQGSAPHEVFYFERGLVKLTRLGEGGQELIVGLKSPGCFLGAAAAIVQKPHAVSVTTLIACQVRRINLHAFLDEACNNSLLSWYLHQMHSHEVHSQADQLAGFRYLSARQRLEQLLWQLVGAAGLQDGTQPTRLHLPLKHWEIAQLIGVTPEHLSRVFNQLAGDGTIKRENGTLVIRDYRRLYRSIEHALY
jgi:CRP-like cAMP-binding protein